MLDERNFPDKLKIAKVVPIHKSDDETMFNNYRPISILPPLSKVFEKVICCVGTPLCPRCMTPYIVRLSCNDVRLTYSVGPCVISCQMFLKVNFHLIML